LKKRDKVRRSGAEVLNAIEIGLVAVASHRVLRG
jgi:hypothetical protein